MQLSNSLKNFRETVCHEPSLLVEKLWDAPKALLIKLLQEATGKDIVVLTADSKNSRLFDDAPYFNLPEVIDFPSWEILPGEEVAPSSDIIGKRLLILHRLSLKRESPSLIVTPLQALLQKLPSPAFLTSLCHTLKTGDTINFSSLPTWLSSLGYRRSSVVGDKGEFSLRSNILDIFPVGSTDPYRVEFFDDTIENIRLFDPVGQKSVAKTTSLFLSPAVEIELIDSNPHSFFSYLGSNTLVIFDHLLMLEDHYVAFQQFFSSYSRLFFTFEQLFNELKNLQKIYWTDVPIESLAQVRIKEKKKATLHPLSFEFFGLWLETKRWDHPFLPVQGYLPMIDRSPHLDIHFICSNEAEEKKIKDVISMPEKFQIERGYLSSGFALFDSNLILIPMTELTHQKKIHREKWRSTYHTPPSDFHELDSGDFVVHFYHGIGRYWGVEKKIDHLGKESEFFIIEYAEKSKLFVPISQTHLISRYIGTKETIPTLHTLGTKSWQRSKIQVQKAIVGYARQLLQMKAERIVRGGTSFPEDTNEMKSFEEEFPYIETEDQLRAIEEVKQDMMSTKAMDRLLCGDVGYGKTEVAMRAAFKAVVEGKKQVAVLVPTTVLALQHYETFLERMINYPIIIKVVSRFEPVKKIKEAIKQTAEGKVDILIGTHRILSGDIAFSDLGLIIIDEEQRFGVRSKEKLKALKIGVDCLTLTATPIPRTLYLSLVGARPISVINTPPQDRLPIRTTIAQREPSLILNALLRELSRNGQAYFIHNRVETIAPIYHEIQRLVPLARVGLGHGQMSKDELDTVFHAFKKGDIDILVATTIVENGIDISNANTILIDRADQFGLADLYQLRGRVGRWNRPAYAYFLVPNEKELAEISRKRLSVLVESQGYGSGMRIALRDLEIRGAGNLLGVEQSGNVSAIGLHFYCKLLKRTVESLEKDIEPTFFDTKMEFPHITAKIPETYIEERSLRLEIYYRLGDLSSLEEVDALFSELNDRFGKPPQPVVWLYHLSRIRVAAAKLRFTYLKLTQHFLEVGGKNIKKRFHLNPYKTPMELENQFFKLFQHITL